MYKAEGEISMPSMELFIETLTGTSMILHVSPLDTVLDVKTHIQKLEGMLHLSLNFQLNKILIHKHSTVACEAKIVILFISQYSANPHIHRHIAGGAAAPQAVGEVGNF